MRLLAALSLSLLLPSSTLWAADLTYWQDVRPLLRKHCLVCHSAKNLQELDVSGGLALDTYTATMKGVKKPVVQAGKSEQSTLYTLLVTTDTEKRMPIGAQAVPKEVAELVKKWIETGAKEGTKPEADSGTLVTSAPARPVRKLDILLPTPVVPAKGVLGAAAPTKLELAAKVGPLAPVTAVAFSPEGKYLAVGSYRLVTIWDLSTGLPTKTLTNVLGAVNDLRFSPSGEVLVVAGGQPSAKGDLRLYRVADWKLLASLGGHEDVVFQVAFTPDGKRFASASFDKTVRIWDLASQKVVQTLVGHSDFVYAVAFSPDGKWLASASKDRTVKVHEAATGKSMLTLSGMEQDVLAVAVTKDGKSVLSSGFEAGIYWWNAQTGERSKVQSGHGTAVHEITMNKEGTLFASAGADRTAKLWNSSTGAVEKTLSVGSIVYAVGFSSDGKQLATGSYDGLVRLWDVTSGRQLLALLAVSAGSEQADWVCSTPEGYTTSSPGFAKLAQWRMAGQPVPSEVVWKSLSKPELLLKAFKGETLPAAVVP